MCIILKNIGRIDQWPYIEGRSSEGDESGETTPEICWEEGIFVAAILFARPSSESTRPLRTISIPVDIDIPYSQLSTMIIAMQAITAVAADTTFRFLVPDYRKLPSLQMQGVRASVSYNTKHLALSSILAWCGLRLNWFARTA